MEQPDDPKDRERRERLRELAEELRRRPSGRERFERRLEDERGRLRREGRRRSSSAAGKATNTLPPAASSGTTARAPRPARARRAAVR
jgi:hypothetical protein